METVVAYAAAGIGVVLGILGMLVSVHAPQGSAEKRALAACFGLLALVAIGTAYAHYRLESRQSADLSELRATENAYLEEVKALKAANDLSATENEKLVAENAVLLRKINALENRVAAAETAQALKRDIGDHLAQVRGFLDKRDQERRAMLMTPAMQQRFQMETASHYFRIFFRTTVSLLERAVAVGLAAAGSFAKDDEFIKNSIAAGRIASTHLRQLDAVARQIP